MKAIFHALLGVSLICVLLSGCTRKIEIQRVPVEVEHKDAYSSIETDVEYRYSIFEGRFVMIPITHTVDHPEQWKVLYEITYDDGAVKEKWIDVDYDTYRAAVENLRE